MERWLATKNKLCCTCKFEKPIDEFSKNKTKKDGRQTQCKACWAAYDANNKKEKASYNAAYGASHKKERAAYDAAYNARHKKEKAAYKRNRLKTDPNYKIAQLLRSRLCQAIKGCYKAGSAVRDLGCTIEELFVYFEPLFEPGMDRQNLGTAWQIDHIIPLASFDLTDRDQLKIACHYTNLQPLIPAENRAKGDKLDWDHKAYIRSKNIDYTTSLESLRVS